MKAKRYLVLAEGHSADPHHGKTMRGVVRYAPDPVVAILDSTRAGETFEGIPIVARVADSLCFGPTTAIIGVAPTGGVLPPVWRELLKASISQGLDVESGMHVFLGDDPELADRARRHKVELRDLRRPPEGIGVPTGENLRLDAHIVHTVGSDCAIGKKTMALELDLEARRRGLRSVFVPTGQTGIAIAGWGIAVDSVVSDFVAGAAERLVVEGAARGDLLWVEGQGSLVHPVLLGRHARPLPRGHAPSARPLPQGGRTRTSRSFPEHPDPAASRAGRALRTRGAARAAGPGGGDRAEHDEPADEKAARRAIAEAEEAVQLVADDPVRFGAGRLVDAVLERLPAFRR